MQTSIDSFVTRAKHSENGGLGAINLKGFAPSLRMAWVKRAKGGLWSDIMTTKVVNPINICYLESKDIHKMHSGIKHIVESFQEVHKAYKELPTRFAMKRKLIKNVANTFHKLLRKTFTCPGLIILARN